MSSLSPAPLTSIALRKRARSPTAQDRSGARRRRLNNSDPVRVIHSPCLSPDRPGDMLCAETLEDSGATPPRIQDSSSPVSSPVVIPSGTSSRVADAAAKTTQDIQSARMAHLGTCNQARDYLQNLATMELAPGFVRAQMFDHYTHDLPANIQATLNNVGIVLHIMPVAFESMCMYLRTALLWLDGDEKGSRCIVQNFKAWHASRFITISHFNMRTLMHSAAALTLKLHTPDYVVAERDTCFLLQHNKWTAPQYCRPSPRTLFEVIVATKERERPRYGNTRQWAESSIDTVTTMLHSGLGDTDVILFLSPGALATCPDKSSIMCGKIKGMVLQPKVSSKCKTDAFVMVQCALIAGRPAVTVPVVICKIEGVMVMDPPDAME